MQTSGASLVMFNHELSPAQERNLEKALRLPRGRSQQPDTRYLRAARASHEGKLQVELAQLEHLATRLVRGWTHLERQKGGIGLRGPGETQLETDRRLLRKRVKVLKDKLAHGAQAARRCNGVRAPRGASVVGLAGRLHQCRQIDAVQPAHHGDAYAADQLFATLDTTSRRINSGGTARRWCVSDTVGFIRDLPHTLVAAFRATLEETVQADLLLHVVDAASPARDDQIAEVNACSRRSAPSAVPQIMVFNKIDLAGLAPGVERDEYGRIAAVRVSARTGAGIDESAITLLGDLHEVATRPPRASPQPDRNLLVSGLSKESKHRWH